MSSSNIIPMAERDHFWEVVRGCIKSFHACCEDLALTKATSLQQRVNGMPVEEMELFYHAEPFDVACDLAGNRLDVKNYLQRYLEIRDS